MKEFGKYFREARVQAGIGSQSDAAKLLGVSQSLIAQYENGVIADPDPALLASAAKHFCSDHFRADYLEMVLTLVQAKYAPKQNAAAWEALDQNRWCLINAALKRRETTGGLKDDELEMAQLTSKATLVKECDILDLVGVLNWESRFSGLQQLWIVVPDFLDDENTQIFNTVVKMVKGGVYVVYFIDERFTGEGGRFWALQQRFAKAMNGRSRSHIHKIGLHVDEIRWIHADHIVANPHLRGKARGFQFFRRARKASYALGMDEADLRPLIESLQTRAGSDEDFRKIQERVLMLH